MRITNHNRTINRQKLERVELEEELISPVSLRYQVFTRFRQMLLVRSSSAAFHPHGSQKVLGVGNNIFALSRVSPDGTKNVLCLQNVTQQEQRIENLINKTARDLLTNRSQSSEIILQPYQTMWLMIP